MLPPPANRSPHASLLWLWLGVGVAALVLAWPALQGTVLADFDLREQFLPWRLFYDQCLAQGELGTWNPWLARGYPHLAEGQAGLLHPLHLLAYWALPVTPAIVLEMLGVYPFAFIGAWLWLRRAWGLAVLPAGLGAAAVALAGVLLAHFPHVNLQWALAHLPWLLWALHGVWRGARPALAAAGLAVGLASLLLLGHPQVTWLLLAALALAAALYRWRTPWTTSHPRRVRLLLVAGLAGLLLGMPQLLPTALLLRDSPRAQLSLPERLNYSLHPANALLQLAPWALADHVLPDTVVAVDGQAKLLRNPSEQAAYLGLPLLSLAWAGLLLWCWARPGRSVAPPLATDHGTAPQPTISHIHARWWPWALVVLLLLLLALGRYGGVAWLLAQVPVLGQFRCPARWLALVQVLLALSGALSLQRLLRHPPPLAALGWRHLGWLSLPLLLSLLLAGLALAHLALVGPGGNLPWAGQTLALQRPALLLLGPLLAALALGCLLLHCRRPGGPWLGLLALLIIFDLLAWQMPLWRASPRRTFTDLRVAALKHATAEHPHRRLANLNEPVWDGHYLANGYLGLGPPEPLALTPDAPPALLASHLRLAAVDQIITREGTLPVPPPVWPRARLLPKLRVHPEPLAAAATADLANEALIAPGYAEAFAGPPLNAAEKVAFRHDGADTITLAVTVTAPRLLVLADRWWPGWSVRVDAQPRPALPLFGGAQRGVLVQPGDQVVQWRFAAPGLARGALLALLGLALLLNLLVTGWRCPPCPPPN